MNSACFLLLVSLVGLLAAAANAKNVTYDPELLARYVSAGDSAFQIHIHWTGVDAERVFSYVTPDSSNSAADPPTNIQYGTDSSNLTQSVTGTSFRFGTDGHYFYVHNIKLTGLQQDTLYYYRVGDDSTGWSDVHSTFTKSNNITYAVYGDFGLDNDVSLNELVTEVEAGQFDAVIHVGDFAYDLDSQEGKVGDAFMASIQPIASRVPYMVSAGNHENGFNFSHYLNRFSGINIGAGQLSNSYTNLWYSFDQNLVHWVVISTEVYAYYADPVEQQRQLAWLEQDLIQANANRENVPWIIMFGHKFEFMDKTNWTGFWPLAHNYGVDLYFCGHQHNYQRNYPYYDSTIDRPANNNYYVDPKFMTAIVVGSPGCKEDLATGMNSADKLAFSAVDYGFGHLSIMNSTHLYWTFEKTQSSMNDTGITWSDYLWLIQHNHGPRA